MLRFNTDCGERSVGKCGTWTEILLWELNGKNYRSMVCFVLKDEAVHISRRSPPIKSGSSNVSPEKFAATKAVQFTPVDELLEVETGKKRKGRRSSLVELLHRSRKDSADDEVEDPELEQVKFHELLALNLPDWYLVLLGVICSALLGALFPLMAVVFSGFLDVSARLSFFCTIFEKFFEKTF